MIGIIVDGPGDYASIKKGFSQGCRILKTDGPRGHSVSVNKLVSSAKKQVSMLKAMGCGNVILLFDFEQRNEEYDDFIDRVRGEIQKQTFPVNVYPCVPNTMIENWYLADVEELSRKKVFIKDNIKQKNYEGTHGKDEVKKLMKVGHSYNEITHGQQLMEIMRSDVAVRNSNSFREFIETMQMCCGDEKDCR